MRYRSILAAAVVPLALALGACSGGGGGADRAAAGASAGSTSGAADAQLAYAQCLREHGVDVKDPAPGQPVRITSENGSLDMAKVQAATQACQHYMQGAAPADANPNDPQMHDQMVRFAQCMRQNGVDIADPPPGQGLRMVVPQGNQAKMDAAQKTCNHFLPGFMQQGGTTTQSTGGQ